MARCDWHEREYLSEHGCPECNKFISASADIAAKQVREAVVLPLKRRISELESKLGDREKDHEALVNILARRCGELEAAEQHVKILQAQVQEYGSRLDSIRAIVGERAHYIRESATLYFHDANAFDEMLVCAPVVERHEHNYGDDGRCSCGIHALE